MKLKGGERETNMKHDIKAWCFNSAQAHDPYKIALLTHSSIFTFRLFFFPLRCEFSHSLCFSRSHRFYGAPLPSPCALSHWPSSGRTWTALLAQPSRLRDVHTAVLAQRLSTVRELRQSGSCSADIYIQESFCTAKNSFVYDISSCFEKWNPRSW